MNKNLSLRYNKVMNVLSHLSEPELLVESDTEAASNLRIKAEILREKLEFQAYKRRQQLLEAKVFHLEELELIDNELMELSMLMPILEEIDNYE